MISAITPSELRLGNWVDAYHGCVQIVAIKEGLHGIQTTPNLIGASFGSMLSGIPLTVEILEKLGFKIERVYSENSDGLHRRTNRILAFDYIDNNPIVIYNDKKNRNLISYLHQFQNWYFILTGKELEYTP